MTVELIATIQVFQGLKEDTKPEDAPIGSRFQELDGLEWIRHEGQWQVAPNYLEQIVLNTNAIVQGLSRAHTDSGKVLAAVKRITQR